MQVALEFKPKECVEPLQVRKEVQEVGRAFEAGLACWAKFC